MLPDQNFVLGLSSGHVGDWVGASLGFDDVGDRVGDGVVYKEGYSGVSIEKMS